MRTTAAIDYEANFQYFIHEGFAFLRISGKSLTEYLLPVRQDHERSL
ncbi:MAG: hypothetical protein WA647_19085 [Candidatus Acidiferrum sp.]